MRTLICGSIAYDTIMVFRDRFQNHILPDQLHILNVAFLVPDMRREFGGCAGNIAYTLKLLGGDPLIMATVGDDDEPYSYRLKKLGLSQEHVRKVADTFTAQAFITTDLDDNQITAFHPGAMNHSHENHVRDANSVKLGIVAPDGREGMLQHAREFHAAGIPFVFDPGQGLPMFNADELNEFVKMASFVAVNDYEGQLLQERTGKKLEELAQQVQALVVTLGARGSLILADGRRIEIAGVKAEVVADPTGCGDAYRAGLLYGIAAGFDWPTTGRLASLLGAVKIAQRGAQNHQFSRDEIVERYKEQFGSRPW
ncbi:MAG: carbohydrate kinase family protein [Betaproteobacteria bacterium]|nr:carbohydrate kinase family protein [Betaproteobacteria bacterium]MDH3437557.1 carbohydrate kinase family protein [Betaproteobacteria bacterium]